MNFADYFSILGILIGVTLSGVVWLAHRDDRPTRFLAAFLFTIAARAVPGLLFRLPDVEAKSVVIFLPLYFFYLSIPLLYLYILRLTGRFDWRRDWIHLIPGVLEAIFCSCLVLLQLLLQGPLFGPEMSRGVLGTYSILSIGPGLFYTYLVIRELGRAQSTLLHYYSNLDGRRLRWIAHALYFNIGVAVIYVLLRYGFVFNNPDLGILFGAVANTLLVTYISIQGIRQLGLRTAVEDEPDTPDEERDVAYPAEEAHPHSVLFERVDRYLRESKAYLNAQLTVGDLARELGCGERTLSRVINSETEDHFNGYINDFRIATAKELLADPAYDHYTMDAIAEEAGFNSKATFYKAFRRHSDLSPAVYRRQHRAA